MIGWAGWLILLFGAAHTVLALTVVGAGRHAGAWFGGALWHEDFFPMSPAQSALWFSLHSFGPPWVVVGALILWLDRRGIVPPAFVAWALLAWTVFDAVVLPFTPWPITIIAGILLLLGRRKALRA